MALGVLTFGFVGYQLWGTGIETELAQQQLQDEFEEMLADSRSSASDPPQVPSNTSAVFVDGEPSPARLTDDEQPGRDGVPLSTRSDAAPAEQDATRAVPVADQRLPDLNGGSAVARMEIEAIDVDDIVVAGIGVSDLKRGPGHFPDTPLPGQLGNSAIAGHRTTYGAPFFDVDRLVAGDDVVVTTLSGRFVYEVDTSIVVSPDDYDVIATRDPTQARLTLVSCEPKWTATNRIIVTAVLDESRSSTVGEAFIQTAVTADGGESPDIESDPVAADSTIGSDSPAAAPSGNDSSISQTTQRSDLADAFGQGWFSDPSAFGHVALWGSVLTLVAVSAWMLSRRTRRDLVGALVGIGPFLVALYFLYQNVNRLLPPSL